jgi:hypothetical protein
MSVVTVGSLESFEFTIFKVTLITPQGSSDPVTATVVSVEFLNSFPVNYTAASVVAMNTGNLPLYVAFVTAQGTPIDFGGWPSCHPEPDSR